MILILDNGGHYSDHSIYFVDCDGMDPDEIVRLFVLTRGRYNQPREIGRAESIAWRDPSTLAKPESVIDSLEAEDTIDLTTLSDRAIAVLAETTWEPGARDLIEEEQYRRLVAAEEGRR